MTHAHLQRTEQTSQQQQPASPSRGDDQASRQGFLDYLRGLSDQGTAQRAEQEVEQRAGPPYPGVVLRIGSGGPAVVQCQTMLNAHGAALDTDGAFGGLTQGAVIGFQRGQGLAVDGLVGPMTWGALAAQDQGTEVVEAPPTGGDLTVEQRRLVGQSLVGGLPTLAQQQPTVAHAITGAVVDQARRLERPKTPVEHALAALLVAVVDIPKQPHPAGGTYGAADQVAALDFLDEQVSAALDQPPPAVSAWLGRLRGMRGFYASMAGPQAVPERPGDMPAQRPVSAARQATVGLALAQVGKVVAKGPLTDVDEQGQPAREGWRALTMYFDAAYGKYPDPDLLKRPRAGSKAVHGKPGERVHTQDVLPSWCGIFATWANVAGGQLPAGSFPTMPTKLTPDFSRVPQPGDILNKSARNHFGVLTWIETPASPSPTPQEIQKLKIRTVEGNTGPQSEVQARTGTLSDWNWGARDPDSW